MLRMKKISETYGMKVYTDEGDFFGEVEESVMTSTKVYNWKIRASKGSYLGKVLGGAKGVIVPHSLVRSMGDVMIISRNAAPALPDDD